MTPEELKVLAAKKAVEYVSDGLVVGLGTGSTAEHAIRALGERVAAGLQVRCVPTSEASHRLGQEVGLDITGMEDEPVVDLTIDGADEVDPNLDLIKGLGGALLREKIVAAASTRQIIIVDESKLVDRLGARSPLPVEVIPFAWAVVQRRLMELAPRAELRRTSSGEEFVTDNGNLILDCHFPDGIDDAAQIEREVNDVPGVVENGLFVGLVDLVVAARSDCSCEVIERPRRR